MQSPSSRAPSTDGRRPWKSCTSASLWPFRPFGGQGAGATLPERAARQGRAQKRLAELAEAIGEADPQGAAQRLLNAAKWDADLVCDDLREYVLEHLGDEESGVLIVDDTGFLKKGEKSLGVARQYTGTAGDTVNCQVGVFLAYASRKGAAFVDRALYLPKEWAQDMVRRTEAGVPEEVRFANKLKLAKGMLKRAFEADVPASWVVADSFYGRSHDFRSWLEKRGCPYAVMVPKTNAVRYQGRRKKKIEQLVKRLPEDAWALVTPTGESSHGRRPWEWACLELCADPEKEMQRWLLVRRGSSEDPEDLTFYQTYGPPQAASTAELIGVCQKRWKIEDCFGEATKAEVGLEQYEVRRWEAWGTATSRCAC
jgi:SRSO17 transposase